MADIRINSLPTTATSTSFDDYVAVDGSGNGTRKLSAYSPTFGGNLTVSGTGSFGGAVSTLVSTNGESRLSNRNTSAGAAAYSSFLLGNDIAPNLGALYAFSTGFTTSAQYVADTLVLESSRSAGMGISTTNGGPIKFWHNGVNTATFTSSAATLAGNLTVSGGTITGGSSGMSLASGGTNQNITLTPSGTGAVNISPVGTTNPIRIGINSSAPTYGMLTFNNVFNALGCLGLTAGGGTDTNLYFNVPTGGVFDFRVNNNPLIKFDTNGNLTVSGTGTSSVAGKLGIGTTAPTTSLHIAGSTGSSTDFALMGSNVAYAVFDKETVATAGNAYGIRIGKYGYSSLAIGWNKNTISGDIPANAAYIGINGADKDISFAHQLDTTPLTRVLIKSTGNLLIGTTTDGGQKLQVSGTAAISGGIVGTTTNDNAAAGIVGEYVSSTVGAGSAITLTTATAANLTSITLTPGDWDVVFVPHFWGAGGSVTGTQCVSSLSTTSATLDTTPDRIAQFPSVPTSAADLTVAIPATRFSVTSSTIIYGVVRSTFTVGTNKVYGVLSARRVR